MPVPPGFKIVREEKLKLPPGFKIVSVRAAPPEPSFPQWIKHKWEMDNANKIWASYGKAARDGLMNSEEALNKARASRQKAIETAGFYKAPGFTERPFTYMGGALAGIMPYMIESTTEGLKTGMAVGLGAAGMTAASGLAPMAPQMAITGLGVGFAAGVFKNIYDREGGALYLDILDRIGVGKEKERLARIYSIAGGAIIGFLEMAQFGMIGKFFKSSVAGKISKKAIGRFILKYGGTIAQETTTEELQEVTSLISEALSALQTGEKPPTAEEWRTRLIETAKEMSASMALLQLPGVAVHTGKVLVDKSLSTEIQNLPNVGVRKSIPPLENVSQAVDYGNEIKNNLVQIKSVYNTLMNEIYSLSRFAENYTAEEKQAKISGINNLAKVIETAIGRELPETETARGILRGITEKQTRVDKLKGELKKIKESSSKIRTKTLKETKLAQQDVIAFMEEAGIPKEERYKFLKTLKNIQTVEQWNKQVDKITERAYKIKERKLKNALNAAIKKELKTTKPLKRGEFRKGRYVHEGNKLFEELIRINKLKKTDAAAELGKYIDLETEKPKVEPESLKSTDILKIQLLNLKRKGAEAGIQLRESFLGRLKEFKSLFAEAAKLEKEGKITETKAIEGKILDAIDKYSIDERSKIKKKLMDIYLRGGGDFYSFLNAMFGRELADELDPTLHEQNRNTAVFLRVDEVSRKSSEVTGYKNLPDFLGNMSKEEYSLTSPKDGVTFKLNKLQILDIYLSLENPAIKERYLEWFNKADIDSLCGVLTPEEMKFGEYMRNVLSEYFPIFNQAHIERYGTELGKVAGIYWPSTAVRKVDVYETYRAQTEIASAMHKRVESKVKPRPVDAWSKFMRHISQGEHLRHLGSTYITLRRLFDSHRVAEEIKNAYGEKLYQAFIKKIKRLSLTQYEQDIDIITSTMGKMLNNWVKAKVGINPSVLVKQLISTGFYAEQMPVKKWIGYFMEGMSKPRETFDFMWKTIPDLRARFARGYSEALQNAIKEASALNSAKYNWTRALTLLSRTGDITAIIYGGYPLIKYELNKHGDLNKAINKFLKATVRAQQSGLTTTRSELQNNRSVLTRWLTAFKNAPSQFMRKLGDATISYSRREISVSQYAKTLAIYGVVQPVLYTTVGYVMGRLMYGAFDDEDDFLLRVFNSILLNPITALPIISDAARASLRKIEGLKPGEAIREPLLDDIERGFGKLLKQKIGLSDILEGVGYTVIEPATGAPAGTLISILKRNEKKSKSGGIKLW